MIQMMPAFRLMRASRARVAYAIVTGAIAGALSGVIIADVREAMTRRPLGLEPVVMFLFAFVVQHVLAQVSTRLFARALIKDMVQGLRLDLVRRILGSRQRVLEAHGPGRLIGALTEDVMVASQAAHAWLSVIRAASAIVAAYAYLAWVSIALLPIAAFAGLLAFAAQLALTRIARRYDREARVAQGALFDHLGDLTAGFPQLVLGAERRRTYLADLDAREDLVRSRTASSARIGALASSWATIVTLLTLGAVVFTSEADVDASMLASFALGLLFVQSEIELILGASPRIGRGNAALEALSQLDLVEEEEKETPLTPLTPVTHLNGHNGHHSTEAPVIAMRGATFAFEEPGGFKLGPIDLTFRPGEVVIIAGGNGSGKSTLLKLLVGLYPPTEGEILLNNKIVAGRESIEAYRQTFAVTMVDTHVFRRLFGEEEPHRDVEANRLLARVHMASHARVTENAFSTLDLSKGQLKRLALVRAILQDRPVLVFDEWAADQDPSFKKIFYEEILPELRKKNRTVIATSHDDSYFACADRVIVLEDGKERVKEPSTTGEEERRRAVL